MIPLYATLATAILGFATALFAFLTSAKNGRKINDTQEKVNEVHVLVNSRLTNVMERVDQLTATLNKNAITIPEDPHAL
jgi:hypothetical protein